MTVDLAALAKLASEAWDDGWENLTRRDLLVRPVSRWYTEQEVLETEGIHGDDVAYIAAASPDVVAALCRVALAAKGLTDCWDIEHREIAAFVATDDVSRLNRRNSWQNTQAAEVLLRDALADLDR